MWDSEHEKNEILLTESERNYACVGHKKKVTNWSKIPLILLIYKPSSYLLLSIMAGSGKHEI